MCLLPGHLSHHNTINLILFFGFCGIEKLCLTMQQIRRDQISFSFQKDSFLFPSFNLFARDLTSIAFHDFLLYGFPCLYITRKKMFGVTKWALILMCGWCVSIRLRQLGVSNQIVYDSRSDSNKFGWRNPSDSKSDVDIVLSITNLINFRSLFD